MWIAYKIYYLCDRKQHNQEYGYRYTCCELLTKFIIFAIGNNGKRFAYSNQFVVNCLQNLLSLRSETTFSSVWISYILLWIAYKIYYLCDRKQQTSAACAYHCGCELLTKFIIFAIGNNRTEIFCGCNSVVNCLQNLLSLRSETTVYQFHNSLILLWIAYKIYYLCDRKQPFDFERFYADSCELLTKFIIFAIGNNTLWANRNDPTVVNCLQNLLSLRSETTHTTPMPLRRQLWIAYKIYYLCDRKQLFALSAEYVRSCELLTKFIIFAIGNNQK